MQSFSDAIGARGRALVFAVVFVLAGGCGDDGTAPVPGPGKITATATGIPGQTGNVYAVAAYAYDWFPGATTPAVAGIRATIGSDPYASTSVLYAVDANGDPTVDEKIFDAGKYSVVFFVAAPQSAPSDYAEIRTTVDGNTTATAPAWSGWVHF